MKIILIVLALALGSLSTILARAVSARYGERVDVDGHRLRVHIEGHQGPTVVLETSGMAPLDCWALVQPEVAKFARVFAYDHAGYWGSDAGPLPRDANQVAHELHAALARSGLRPPYVLVGYSFGGPFIRVFAHRYPGEVAGMVLVDPSQEEAFDWLKIHHPELNRITKEDEALQDEWGCSWPSLNQARAAWPLPRVPLTLITAMKPMSDERLSDILPIWTQAHRNWLAKIPHARHIITQTSGHDIVFREPEIVIQAIRDVLNGRE